MLDEKKIIEIGKVKFYAPNLEDSLYALMIRKKKLWSVDRINYMSNFISSSSIVVDAGAHIGTYTLQFAKKAKKIIAIEPVEQNFNLLQINIELNELTNCYLVKKALSDRIGDKLIIDPERERLLQNSAATFLIPSQNGTIDTTTLDALLVNEKDSISFIKISVQEMELEVLRGAIETLKQHKPALYVALVHPGHVNKRRFNNKQTKQFLKDLGYIETRIIGVWVNTKNLEHMKVI